MIFRRYCCSLEFCNCDLGGLGTAHSDCNFITKSFFLIHQWEDTLNEKYPHVVYEEHCKAYEAVECEATSIEDHGSDKLEGL